MPPPDLIATLQDAPDDMGAWIVILWTWLTPQLAALDSRETKLAGIRTSVLSERADPNPDLGLLLDELRVAEDLPDAAAATLARLDRSIGRTGRRETALAGPFHGIDGSAYYVAHWQPWIVDTLWSEEGRGGDSPPATDYAPSMALLAHAVNVVPVDLDAIAIADVQRDALGTPAAPRIARACGQLGMIVGGAARDPERAVDFVVHFATLGPNTLETMAIDRKRRVFSFTDPPPSVIDAIEAQLAKAIAGAADAGAKILVIPELAVPIVSLNHVQTLLAAQRGAPVITVAGLRHADVVSDRGEPETIDRARCSRWANEAVVLDDRGEELFRHRKLTGFAFPDQSERLQEDTRYGVTLPIMRTAAGNVAVAICLDSFGGPARRLKHSYASLVLVPSLSKSVSAHQTSLQEVVRWLWGTAFVCNRHPEKDGEAGWLSVKTRSFWTAALLNGWRGAAELDSGSGAPTLMFDLARELHALNESPVELREDDVGDGPDS